MSIDLLLILAVIVLGFISLAFFIQKLVSGKPKEDVDLEGIVNKVFGMSAQKAAFQSKQILEGEKEAINVNLENKQRMLEKMIQDVKNDLKSRQDELRSLEQDRTKKFGELTSQLDSHREITNELKVSTQQLAKTLSNNQTRGAWGERIIEDLMQSNGLLEGIHYSLQTKLGDSKLKPDVTLLLPNSRVVAVDVKFPYSEIQKMAQAETKVAKESHLKQFGQDLKVKIKKVAEYIDPDNNTLDYAIMFVPNEMVFSFINQKYPDLVDDAISKRVIMVSPFTFLIVARTIMESYRNFMMEDRLREVIKHVDGFVKEWDKFKNQFEKYGRSIDTLKTSYDDMMGTRVRQMEKKIDKIEQDRNGGVLASETKTPFLIENN